MDLQAIAAIAAACLLTGLIAFELALAVGMPWARAAWGGRHRVLPRPLRWASVMAAFLLALAAWAALARAALVPPGPEPAAVRVIVWFFVGYTMLGTGMNAISRSQIERSLMTPLAAALALLFWLVALG